MAHTIAPVIVFANNETIELDFSHTYTMEELEAFAEELETLNPLVIHFAEVLGNKVVIKQVSGEKWDNDFESLVVEAGEEVFDLTLTFFDAATLRAAG